MPTVAIGEYHPITDTRAELIMVYGIEPCYIVRINNFQGKQISEVRTGRYDIAKMQFQYANSNGEFCSEFDS